MIKFFERVFNRLYVFLANRRYHRELREKKLAADNAVGDRAAQDIEYVEPRIDPSTLKAGDWMKILETQENRLAKLRDTCIELRQTVKVQQDEMNVMRRAFELLGVDAFKIHELYHDVSRRSR